MKILIRTRDEVHRFAITYHRKLRSKRNVHSILDEIKGIEYKRKKQLLLKYGTVKNILAQSQEELLKISPLNVVEKLLEIKWSWKKHSTSFFNNNFWYKRSEK